jgi:hypothetical protein
MEQNRIPEHTLYEFGNNKVEEDREIDGKMK